jgi:regulator of cell morphogenesis and NO signaling
MSDCDLDTPVPDWVIDHPETLAVFQELGIDIGCGGKSLEFACRQRGLDAAAVLTKVLGCLDATPTAAGTDRPSTRHQRGSGFGEYA